MNLEKLKPWNWFKHEEQAASQIPVAKNEANGFHEAQANTALPAVGSAVRPFLQLHQEVDRLFYDVWRSFGLPSSSTSMPRSPLSGSSLFDNTVLGGYRAKLDVAGGEKEY